MDTSLTLRLTLGAFVTFLAYRHFRRHEKSRGRLPPGPKPLPLVGNVRDFPQVGVPEFQHWLQHKDLYGPISSVTVMGLTIVLLHDKKAAHDLLEKSSSKTSGRPDMVFANQMCGYGSIMLCQGYNQTFRRWRKLLHQELGTKVLAARFREVQEVQVNRQLVRALDDPDRWLKHFKTTTSATVLRMAYGYTVESSGKDPLVDLNERLGAELSLAAVPMSWAVDVIPALRYLPEWFPGAGFKRTARKWKKTVQAVAWTPYRFVRRQMDKGTYATSYVSRLLGEHVDGDMSPEEEEAIVWTAAGLYGAGGETTVITLTAFTLAMVLYPEVQRKAQEEIDRVVGTGRLPTFEDRERLPYVDALVKEAVRWWPITPLGFPHATDDEIEYEGMRIPKGAYILPSVWWFLHDPAVYADPETFDPERFLGERGEPDPVSDAFGYGRRICPGRFFADDGLFLNIARSLAVFDLGRKVGEDGRGVEVEVKAQPGVLSYPAEFEFSARPRSEQHAGLARRTEGGGHWEEGDGGHLEEAYE